MLLDLAGDYIGSGNGLLLLGNKPLPEPMLYAAKWCHKAAISLVSFDMDR